MLDDPQGALSEAERRALRQIAGLMIPASAEYDVPGADDPAIFADIVRSIGRDMGVVRQILSAMPKTGDADLTALLTPGSQTALVLGRVVLQCYYRDDRVLTALGHEARAPFPNGHALEQGDWSLLDPVKRRPQLWREA